MSRKRQRLKKQKKSNLAQYMARSERNPMEGSKKRVRAMLSYKGKKGAKQGAKLAKMINGLASKQSTLVSTSQEQSTGGSEMSSLTAKSMAGPSKRNYTRSNAGTPDGASTAQTPQENIKDMEAHGPKPSSTVTEIFSQTKSESPLRPSAYLDEAPWYELPPGPLTAGLILGFVITLALIAGGWW